MGGFCGVISREDCVTDLFFGIDYHSHLGTHRGGMAVLEPEGKFLRAIHNIQNAPFRTKFEQDFARFRGHAGLGVISDTDPQPLVMASHLGVCALVTVGLVANMEALKNELFENRHAQLQYSTTSGALGQTELVSAIIASQDTIVDGLRRVQAVVEGSLSLLLVTADGTFYAMRDRYGRTPVVLGRRDGAMIAVQESCALANLGYEHLRDLGPGEVVVMTPDGARTVVEPGDTMAICSFLWVYYGYPASSYEGRNVEMARYRCGGCLARRNPVEADNVGGVPDSGTSHALGYAHEAGLKYARPFVKYTPTWARSFMPGDQRQRDRVASMKLIPIPGLIRDKRLVFCDDSIVRGTQLGNQAKRLYHYGAKEAHMRIACPLPQLLALEERLRPHHAPLHPRTGGGERRGEHREVPGSGFARVQGHGRIHPKEPRPLLPRLPAPRRPRGGHRPAEGQDLHLLLRRTRSVAGRHLPQLPPRAE